ncbi:MAG: geranylgeranyl reductase family protein [Candidatus Diapherotrites archaeon]|nr:geranylgeranyl reductase family protein [Candidatus Diapherotrites archaeon]
MEVERMQVQPTDFDVIVSGAGPAGTACALFLARSGHNVLVLEKDQFPRDKVCADNKTWKCLDIVKELGLWAEFERLPKRQIDGVRVTSPSGNEMYTPLHREDVRVKGPWFNVRRYHFDFMLAKACKKEKNIAFKEQCEVVRPLFDSKKPLQVIGVEFKNAQGRTEHAYARVVVGADGSTSPIAQAVGVSPRVKGRYALNTRAYFENVHGVHNQCELYYLKGVCPGYFWIFPVDEKTCNVGVGMRMEDIERQGVSLDEKLKELLLSPAFKERFCNARQVTPLKQWGLSVLGQRRKCAGSGWVLVGDAGTFAMTFSGEGCGPGMRSGKIAAQSLHTALQKKDVSEKSLRLYEENLWRVLEPEVKGFRWLEFLLLHEGVFDWVIKKASKNKELIELSSRMQNDYTLARRLSSPATLLKLLLT